METGPVDEPDESSGRVDPATYPNVKRLEPLLARDEAAEEFEDALEILLGRLALLRTSGASRTS